MECDEDVVARDAERSAAASAFEAVTRLMVENLAEDVKEIRNRINGMFWLIAGTVVIDLVLRVTGMGS